MPTVTTSIGQGTGHDQNVNITGVSGSGPYTVTLADPGTDVVNGDALWDEHATPRKYLITSGGGTTSLTVVDSTGVGAAPDQSGTSTAEVKRYYNDSTPITDWESELDDTDLYASSDDALGECYNDAAFDETVTIDGGGTVGLSSRTLTVASGEEHDGTEGTGVRIQYSANPTARCVFISITNTTVSWLEIDLNGYTQTDKGYSAIEIADLTNTLYSEVVSHCIVHGKGAGPVAPAFKGASARQSTWLNCIGYDWVGNEDTGSAFVIFSGTDDKSYFLNCTAHDLDRTDAEPNGEAEGFNLGTSSLCKNCIATDIIHSGGGLSPECFSESGANIEYNLSSDATASGTGSLTSKTSSNQFVSTTGGSEDLHLKTGADAIDAGTDLGTTPSGVEIDIDGRDRDAEGDTWDIGADEFVTVAAGTPTQRRMPRGFERGILRGMK